MPSQLDLDQGGSFRQTQKVYLGPSIGWQEVAEQWIWNVVAGGVTAISRGTSLILVNFNGAVTLQLPSFRASAAGAQAIPRQFAIIPVILVDAGGFSGANPITINTFAGELVSGLSTFQLSSPFGSFIIRPDIINGGGTLIQ